MTAAAPVLPNTSLRALQRELARRLPESGGSDGAPGPSLEASVSAIEVPRLMSAAVLEDSAFCVHEVGRAAGTGFVAFVDGTQASHVIRHVDGVPIIRGTVAAVVRERRERRLSTWRHIVRSSVYAPRRLLSARANAALDDLGVDVCDTSVDAGAEIIAHPFAVRDAAIHFVQKDRERAERQLVKAWCDVVGRPLFLDGGVSGGERAAGDDCVVGVVKSHRTLYAQGDGLQIILRLGPGERSSVFQITSSRRNVVASWYLRLRDGAGRDPMWGLVRVEIHDVRGAAAPAITRRADDVSRWILAEAAPIAAPDARWDKMMYGIRDCEEFLRAVM